MHKKGKDLKTIYENMYKKGKWLKTTYMAGEELDIYKVGKKIVGFKGGTDTPSRIWQNISDFHWAEKILSLV
jgi:hypothetical protein